MSFFKNRIKEQEKTIRQLEEKQRISKAGKQYGIIWTNIVMLLFELSIYIV